MLKTSLTLITILMSAHAAAAQAVDGTRASDNYTPGETSHDGFSLSRPLVLSHLRYDAQLTLDYARNPLVWEADAGDPDSEQFAIVQDQLVAHLGFALGIKDRALVWAGVPINVLSRGETDPGVMLAADGAGLGDPRLGARVRLFSKGRHALALQAALTLPIADAADDAQQFAGSQRVEVEPRLVGEVGLGAKASLLLNAGLRFRDAVTLTTADLGNELSFGVGALVPLATKLVGHVELTGATSLEAFGGRTETAFEALAGVRYGDDSGLRLGLAAGPGLTRGYGTPDVRALATVAYTAPLDQLIKIEKEPPPPVDGDQDRDGILDSKDACKTDPEDLDTFEDLDGCPDLDDDADGVPDASDGCRTEPEDMDTFEDTNGCPDPDNDADGVLDGEDACPLVAGGAATRGCPDRDGDTVIDTEDRCPDVAGDPAQAGCPLAVVSDTKIELLDRIYFDTDKATIKSESFPVLDSVVKAMTDHPKIKVQVVGHTDSVGSKSSNRKLSKKRAAAVVAYLVDKGIDKARLTSDGKGPDEPLVKNASTAEDLAQNRRVEFNIVD